MFYANIKSKVGKSSAKCWWAKRLAKQQQNVATSGTEMGPVRNMHLALKMSIGNVTKQARSTFEHWDVNISPTNIQNMFGLIWNTLYKHQKLLSRPFICAYSRYCVLLDIRDAPLYDAFKKKCFIQEKHRLTIAVVDVSKSYLPGFVFNKNGDPGQTLLLVSTRMYCSWRTPLSQDAANPNIQRELTPMKVL